MSTLPPAFLSALPPVRWEDREHASGPMAGLAGDERVPLDSCGSCGSCGSCRSGNDETS